MSHMALRQYFSSARMAGMVPSPGCCFSCCQNQKCLDLQKFQLRLGVQSTWGGVEKQLLYVSIFTVPIFKVTELILR